MHGASDLRRIASPQDLPHRKPYEEVLDYYMPKIKEAKALDNLSLKAKSYFSFQPIAKKILTIQKTCHGFCTF